MKTRRTSLLLIKINYLNFTFAQLKGFSLIQRFFLLFVSLSLSVPTMGQVTGATGSSLIHTAVPFLTINSALPSAGMGEIGVVASPSNYHSALQQNPSLLAREQQVYGGQAVFTPWLRALGYPGINLFDAEGFASIAPNQTLGIKLRYFSLGEVFLFSPIAVREIRPKEFRAGLSYALALNEHFSLGIGLNFFSSNFASKNPYNMINTPVRSVSTDLGWDYRRNFSLVENVNLRLNIAGSLLHLGPKVQYLASSSSGDFIPTTLKLGGMLTVERTIGHEKFLDTDVALQLDKLLVPSEGGQSDRPLLAGMAGSFFDAPGGFSEELEEWIIQIGGELRFRGPNQLLLAIRNGYFLESVEKGNRRYLTLGLGAGILGFRLDAAYLVPFQQNHPLQNTSRIGLGYVFLVD